MAPRACRRWLAFPPPRSWTDVPQQNYTAATSGRPLAAPSPSGDRLGWRINPAVAHAPDPVLASEILRITCHLLAGHRRDGQLAGGAGQLLGTPDRAPHVMLIHHARHLGHQIGWRIVSS